MELFDVFVRCIPAFPVRILSLYWNWYMNVLQFLPDTYMHVCTLAEACGLRAIDKTHEFIFKSSRVTGGLIVFGPFPPPPWRVSAAATVSAAVVLPTLFNFLGKPLKLISSNHTWLTYGYGKFFWHPSRWPWVKVTKLPKRDVIYLVHTIKWEALIQSLQNLVGISPSSCFPPG